jgi:hypothetical protein
MAAFKLSAGSGPDSTVAFLVSRSQQQGADLSQESR